MDFGKDIYLDENRDVVFTPSGDVQLIEGAQLVAQDIRENLSIVLGSVYWDTSAGSNLIQALNSSEDLDLTVVNEIERIALEDKRVLASSVDTEILEKGKYKLSFQVVDTIESGELYFDLKELLNG
ncbi:MAG: hypothetical protein ACPKOI_05810 [Pleomorphochaeta sp.]